MLTLLAFAFPLVRVGKYLVFYFYPLDFTFVCPTEIVAYSDRIEEFKKINCEVRMGGHTVV